MPAARPYETALKLGLARPTHVGNTTAAEQDDNDRLTAYATYSDIYHNVESVFNVVMRDDSGEEIARRYVPSARTIIEAANRYLGKALEWVASPIDAAGSPVPDNAIAEAMSFLDALFMREEFVPKLLSLKRWMLIRGDALLHISVDDSKPSGTKLRITELDPTVYFRIKDPIDTERLLGCYLVSVMLDDNNNEIVQRLSYRKTEAGRIAVQLGFFEVDGWDDREDPAALKPVVVPEAMRSSPSIALAMAGFELPPQITSIPVYHFRNNRRGSEPFGTSEIQGIETLITGINQTATDEDITIALVGLGVYATDSGRPRDDKGRPIEWTLAPAMIMELESGSTMRRIQGIDSIQPLIDHSTYLESKARETTGTADVAVGNVDVSIAQSGIALALQMGPTLAKNEEKELEIKAKLNQLLFDLLNGWLPAYEGYTPTGVVITAEFGNALPEDRAATLKEILDMLAAKMISIAFAQKLAAERLGFTFPSGMVDEIMAEQNAMLDPLGARLDEAANALPPVE